MAIFVVYMTVWKTSFTLYCIMLKKKTPMVDSRCTFLSGWTYDIKAVIVNIHC